MELEKQLCIVCEQSYDALFAVAKCSHKFCQNCSLSYIQSQASNFSSACCLQEGCGALLDKNLPIFKMLDKETLLKLQKFQTYLFLQQNPEYISCKTRDCAGVVLLKEGKCNICKEQHCKKCASLSHEGPCVQTQEDKEMKQLNYRKCPTCRVWVEKIAGCQYIHCKCKTEFCFKCGTQFSKDPCRKRKIWEKEAQIRFLMGRLKIRRPSDPKTVAILIPRLLLFFLILIPITSLFILIPVAVTGIALLICLFVPIVLCQPISQIPSKGLRFLASVLMIICYPLLCGLLMLTFMMIILLYPCLRNKNHHGVYDPFDNGLSILAVQYLKFTVWLMYCCAE